MLSRRLALCLPATLALGRRARAATGPDLPNDIAKASVTDPADIDQSIQDQMQDWIEKSGFGKRNGHDLSVVSNTSPVNVPASNPDWIRYRMLAYTDAFLEAQADYVSTLLTMNLDTTVKDFVKGLDNPPPYQDARTPGQAAEVIRKSLAVASGKLDAQLRDMGVDPQRYEQTPEAQKTELLRNHLKISMIQRSFGAVAGMIPVMTFEGQDGAKNYEIGVVAVASPIMDDFAHQVLTARGQFPPDPARAGDLSKLYQDKSQLLRDFGVRRLFDDQGLPVIVSFAQWASAYRGHNPAVAASYRDAARNQATALADSQISDFLNGSATFDRNGTVGQTLDDIALTLPDDSTREDLPKIVDTAIRRIQRTSSTRLVGQRTLYSWVGKHPASDTPIVGVIRMWSASSEQSVRALQDNHGVQRDGQPDEPTRGAPGVTQGRSLMGSSDF